MIYITKNTTNDICLTLKETNINASPYYIFEFIKQYTTLPLPEDSIYFYSTDSSLYTNRYNRFTLIDNDTTGSTTGGINVPLNLKSGQYKYNIYTSDTISLDPNDFLNLMESGRMIVDGIDTQVVDERYL